jgi:arylsulfatase A-like enzyme
MQGVLHVFHQSRARAGGLAVLLPLLAFAAVWLRDRQREATPTSVVVITLDTTRADRLSTYGFADASMPHLERLAREGVVFHQATSVAPLTLPAHSSLFTGLLPPRHGVRDNADSPLAAGQTTLAEILRAQGFRTAAFVGSVVLDPDRGLSQGFDQYSGVVPDGRPVPVPLQRRAEEVVSEATRWLDGVGDSRFFVWTHLYDPHRPYDPPEPFRSKYAHDPYVGEIAYADSQIGRLIDELERLDLLDRTIVIVAGDHGESLGEHGERDHGIFVYEGVLRVPLIIRASSIAPRPIDAVVRLVDVMPTVLNLLGVPAPPMDGVSLGDLMRGKAGDSDLEAYSESLYPRRLGWSALRAVRAGEFKFIEAPRAELYDLEHDPFELRNIYHERPEIAAALARRLAALNDPPNRPANDSMRPELRQQLAALGYVASSAISSGVGNERAPDPKDCIGLYKDHQDTREFVAVREVDCR